MRKKYLFIIIVIALAVLGVLAARRYLGGKEPKAPNIQRPW